MDTAKNTKKIAKILKKITTWQQKVVKLEAKEKKNNLLYFTKVLNFIIIYMYL